MPRTISNEWTPFTDSDEYANPVVATRKVSDGGTARLYANGMVDAIDGQVYSVSPGFRSFDALESWIARQHRKLNP